MKLIIDVSNDIYERWSNIEMPTVGEVRDVQEAMKVATPIPDNATNGDAIKALFPNFDYEDTTEFYHRMIDLDSHFIKTDKSWWNAPYKKGGTE